MDDLVKRLRKWTVLTGDMTDIHKEAADRIEQLEAELCKAQSDLLAQQHDDAIRIEQLEADILLQQRDTGIELAAKQERIERLEAEVKKLDRANNTLARFNAKQGALMDELLRSTSSKGDDILP